MRQLKSLFGHKDYVNLYTFEHGGREYVVLHHAGKPIVFVFEHVSTPRGDESGMALVARLCPKDNTSETAIAEAKTEIDEQRRRFEQRVDRAR